MTRSQWDSPWDGWERLGSGFRPMELQSLGPDRHARLCCCLVTKSCLTLTTPGTVALQTPVSMGFPRQGYWSGFPFPSLGMSLAQGLNTGLLHWQAYSLSLSHLGGPCQMWCHIVTSSAMQKAANTGVLLGRGNIAMGNFSCLAIKQTSLLGQDDRTPCYRLWDKALVLERKVS